MKILLDYADGRYSTRPLTNEEAANLEAQGIDIAHIEDDVWAEYLQHCGRDGIWQALWRSISNEQWIRRRQDELLPLEAADREIARLKEDLARAERMAKHFEDEWSQLRAIQDQPKPPPSDAGREAAWESWKMAQSTYQNWYGENAKTEFDAWWLRRSFTKETQHYTDEFTCVFPQPGCDVEILPPEWRDRAREILEKPWWRTPSATPSALYCCCGHEHKKLDEETAQQLRNAGYLIEHDSESEDWP